MLMRYGWHDDADAAASVKGGRVTALEEDDDDDESAAPPPSSRYPFVSGYTFGGI